jgi:hypothetical protein
MALGMLRIMLGARRASVGWYGPHLTPAAVTSAAGSREVCVADPSIQRFAEYSDDELAWLLADLRRGNDDRLERLIAEIVKELERRRAASPQP